MRLCVWPAADEFTAKRAIFGLGKPLPPEDIPEGQGALLSPVACSPSVRCTESTLLGPACGALLCRLCCLCCHSTRTADAQTTGTSRDGASECENPKMVGMPGVQSKRWWT